MGKKQDLLKTAVSLFSSQGFDSTTTAEIAAAAGVTEPVIYYYFKNKEDLFATILIRTFDEYFSRLNALETPTRTQFEKITRLIRMHFKFIEDFPEETYIIISACPAKLRASGQVCAKHIEDQRRSSNR